MNASFFRLGRGLILFWIGLALCLPVTAEEQAPPKVAISGKLVLPGKIPAGMDPKSFDLTKLEGTLTLRLFEGDAEKLEEAMGTPENYNEMTPEQQKEWMKKSMKDPDFLLRGMAMSRILEKVHKVPPVPIPFGKDGSFRVDGLPAGRWVLEARIPHHRNKDMAVADFSSDFEIFAKESPREFGEVTLKLHHVILAGDTAPDFTAQTYDGRAVKLSDLRGKHVLIDFWATWCVPCVAQIPDLLKVHEQFAGKDFEVISLNMDQDIGVAKKFEEKKPTPFQHWYISERKKSEAATKFGVRTIPSIWLIGLDGKIIVRDLRGEAIGEAVAKALEPEQQP